MFALKLSGMQIKKKNLFFQALETEAIIPLILANNLTR
jgi:hypothetical protein